MKLTKSVFSGQMNRIIETFGKENFPKPRMEEIWKVVCELPDLDFIRIVSRIVGEQPIKYPPTVKEFREHAEVKLKELRDNGSQEWEQAADEVAERKKKLEAMTPEEREERKRRIRELTQKIRSM